MSLVDLILNIAAILMWVNWRAIRFDPITHRRPATLVGALKPITPLHSRHWQLPAAIGVLIVVRAFFYWQIGKSFGWSGKLDVGVIALSFRSDSFFRMLLFSFLSFWVALGVFYLWLLLLSILSGPEPFHRMVRMQLGFIDGWARTTKLLLPFFITAILAWLGTWIFGWMAILPAPVSQMHRIEEAIVIAIGSYLVWKFLIVGLFALYLLNSYIYFGKHPFWDYVTVTTQKLLEPLKPVPLRIGKVDLAPIIGIALVLLFAYVAMDGVRLFPRPRGGYLFHAPGLMEFYSRLPI